MKKLFYLATLMAILAVFCAGAYAMDYSIAKHTITTQIGSDGKDTVVEKFVLNFPTEQDKIDFRAASARMGTNLDEWQKFNSAFVQSLSGNTYNKKINYTEGTESFLQISYALLESIMAKGTDSTFLTEYSIKVNYFNSFYQSGLWIIPENTTISIELPPGAEIRDTTEPESVIETSGNRKSVNWVGYKSANRLALNYVVWKKTAPVVDLNAITTFLSKTTAGIITSIVLILIIIAIVWQRKKIGKGIEEFVEKHSIIKEE